MRETWTTSLISEYDFLFFFFFKMKRQMLKCQMLSAAYPRSMMNAWRWFRTCCREPSRKWKSSRSLIETANHVAPSSCCTPTEIPLSISVLVSIFDQHTARKKKGRNQMKKKKFKYAILLQHLLVVHSLSVSDLYSKPSNPKLMKLNQMKRP